MASLSIATLIGSQAEAMVTENRKTIFRTEHNKENPYTLINNKLLRDTSIHHADRGLMAQLLSWKDHHCLCIKALVNKSLEGRDAIRKMISRLITAGYIRCTQVKSLDGRFDKMVYQIYEESTGAVVADLDMGGMGGESIDEDSPQLDLFNLEPLVMNENSTETALTVNGLSVSGKHDTNKDYVLMNTFNNSNIANSEASEQKIEIIETKESLLNRWKLDLKNGMVNAYLGRAGLLGFIQDQDQLNRYLIDFNQQHEKYKHLTETQKIKNFTAYLVRIRHTPSEYKKHVARLIALGFEVQMPSSSKQKAAQKPKGTGTEVNPFEVKAKQLEKAPEFSISIDGF